MEVLLGRAGVDMGVYTRQPDVCRIKRRASECSVYEPSGARVDCSCVQVIDVCEVPLRVL